MKTSNRVIRLALAAAVAAMVSGPLMAAAPAGAQASPRPLAAASLERLMDLQGGHPGLLGQRAGAQSSAVHGVSQSLALAIGIGAAVVVVVAAYIGGRDVYMRGRNYVNSVQTYEKNLNISQNINSNTNGNTTTIDGTITIVNNNSNTNYKSLLPSL